VIPRHLAEEIAVDAAEQEGFEEFIFKRIEEGAPLTGTYPPNEATKEAYMVWKRQNVSGKPTAVR
jgi:regulator of RNase E activity RraA